MALSILAGRQDASTSIQTTTASPDRRSPRSSRPCSSIGTPRRFAAARLRSSTKMPTARVGVLIPREKARMPIHPLIADPDLDGTAASDVPPPACIGGTDHGDPVAPPAEGNARHCPAIQATVVVPQLKQRATTAAGHGRARPPTPDRSPNGRFEAAQDRTNDPAEP